MTRPRHRACSDLRPRASFSCERARRGLWLLAALALIFSHPLPTRADDDPRLEPRHRQWLATVAWLITPEEREAFLALERDYRRDAFVERFWEVRDPYPRTRVNELRRRWEEGIEAARSAALASRSNADPLADDRTRFLLLGGEPFNTCLHPERELEIWFYTGTERTNEDFVVIFQALAPGRPYRVWRPGEHLAGALRRQLPSRDVSDLCRGDTLAEALDHIRRKDFYLVLLDRHLQPPEPPSEEWLATFAAQTTRLPESAETFDAELELSFPGRRQSRTLVQGVIAVPRAEAGRLEAGERASHQFLLTGEVIGEGELFESFRYRFELPAEDAATPLPLVFQRALRPGSYTLSLKVEDLHAGRYALLEREVAVPKVEAGAPGLGGLRSELLELLAEADAQSARGERSVRLIPHSSVVRTGLVRFGTVTTGEIGRVDFYLDDELLMSKNRPPYSVELDLGSVPVVRRLRVIAFDDEGREVASDQALLNPGGQRFRLRFLEPRRGESFERSLRAALEIDVPDGRRLDRVELFLGEERVATLYQEPWAQPVVLREPGGLAYLRAVAYLEDGSSTEELVYVNAPDYFDEVDVRFVEVLAGVFDRAGRPVLGLGRDDFTVVEDGQRQELRRFEWVAELPIHAGLLIDTSASMEGQLERVAEAARSFVETAIEPADRLAVVAFSGRPEVEVAFTNDRAAAAAALARLKAEGGTALYDSLVFTLHYFEGVKGQRALLLLSDGKDESSGFDFEGALDVARRMGVVIYAIGLRDAGTDRGSRRVLTQLAEETGGRSFFIADAAELPPIYAAIEEELRSQYLLGYQSASTRPATELRRLEVKVTDPELEVRAPAGYYP